MGDRTIRSARTGQVFTGIDDDEYNRMVAENAQIESERLGGQLAELEKQFTGLAPSQQAVQSYWDEINSTAPSAWNLAAQQLNEAQGSQQRDKAMQDLQSGTQGAISQAAMAGGLRGGAAARIGQAGQQAYASRLQDVAGDTAQRGMGITLQDAAQKQAARGKMADFAKDTMMQRGRILSGWQQSADTRTQLANED